MRNSMGLRPVVMAMVAALVLAACGDKPEEAGQAAAPGSAAAPASAAPEKKEVKGLAAPGNDQAVVELAKKALDCGWGRSGLDTKCDGYKAWKDSKLFEDGKADATLVSMLEDADEKVRWLAARTLDRDGETYRTDKDLAKRVIEVAKAERDLTVISQLGAVVGRIDLQKTGLGDEVKKMLTDHPVSQMRRRMLSTVLFKNRDLPGLFEFVQDIARKDKDEEVRKAASSAFWTGTPHDRYADSCKLWFELAQDPNDRLAGDAAYLCAFYNMGGGCKDQWAPLLDIIEKKVKEGAIKDTGWASALRYLHGQDKAPEEIKKRTIAIAKALVENTKIEGMARGQALRFVAKAAPDGKAFAARFLEDKEFFVKNAAKDAQKEDEKKK